MGAVFLWVLKLVGCALTLTGALYVLALARPRFFLDWFAVDAQPASPGLRPRKANWWAYTRICWFALSLSFFFYYASDGVFNILPWSWVRVDEDGEVRYVRESLQIFFAMVSACVVLASFERHATTLRAAEMEDSKRREDG